MNTSSHTLRPTGQVPVSSAATDRANAAGRDINITWWYTFLSVAVMSVFLLAIAVVVSTSQIAALNGPAWQTLAVLGLFVANAVTCVYASWLMRDGYGAGWPPARTSVLLLTVPLITWLVTLFIPGATLYGATPLWITLSILLPLIRRSHRLPVTLAGLALLVLHGVLNPGTSRFLEDGFVFGLILLVLLTPSTYLVSGWIWHLIVRLEEASTINSELAVARERLRFASDLHDIQGHHLQVIALKAELADRLLAAGTENGRDAAQQAIAEVRALAEQAQTETRQLVRDLRVVSLGEELDNAKGVLEAADITVYIQADAPETAPTASTRLFGFVVREATTNILRHANATSVTIELDATDDILRLQITNDGAPPPDAKQPHGTGLIGLRQRLQTVGGSLSVTHQADVFHLTVSIPAPQEQP